MELFNPALKENITFVRPAYFVITGFVGIPNVQYYYVFLCFVYLVAVLGNTTVMVVIYLDRCLRTPKYIAIFSLALADFLSTSALVPKVLDLFLYDHKRISYNDCLTFMFFCYIFLLMQPFNLVALAYDRMMAIFYPLHYEVKVTNRIMFSMIIFFWIFSVIVGLVAIGFLTRLSFCRSVEIKSYFCDHGQMYRLACNDNSPNYIISTSLPVLIVWLPLAVILVSYLCIGYVLSKVATVKERLKAFKTCTAHISLVVIYFLPLIVTYIMHESIPPNGRIINLSLASVIPAMLNPIIYVLQTQEIKESLKKLLRIKIHFNIMVAKVTTN